MNFRIEYSYPLWCIYEQTPGYKAEWTGDEEVYVRGYTTREKAEQWVKENQ